MKLLLDTHAVIWALTRDPSLTPAVAGMIQSAENLILVSAASLWEIAIKNQKNAHVCPYHEKEIMQWCELAGYEFLPVTPDHVLQLRKLEVRAGHTLANHDPFDRILLAQAMSEKALLITHDTAFTHYAASCIHMF